MGSARSDGTDGTDGASEAADAQLLAAHKILIAGGFGAGKTTLVSAISEVRPLLTEERLSSAGAGLDDLRGVAGKTTTTVAMDFGRITISERLVLYLFGVPGQERFWFMWDELAYGALGAVVLADVRRLRDCFPSVNYFETRSLPFVVAINCFDDARRYDPGGGPRGARSRPGRPGAAVRRPPAQLGQERADHAGGEHLGGGSEPAPHGQRTAAGVTRLQTWTFSPTSRHGASSRTAPIATRCAPASMKVLSASTTAATRARTACTWET